MVLVRRIHNRGANIVVEAHGEVLFSSAGAVGRFTRRMSQRTRAFAEAEAPSNKRTRWAHYGKPLKATMKASTSYHPSRKRVYAAVGSTSPHAYYVDQGTGVYAGNGPYEAKILPPWSHGDSSLYEHTWRPGGPGTRRVKPVMIRGQKGQFFFDSALKRGFQSMRMRSYQLPGEGASQIKDALASIPTGLTGFLGNTVADGAFVAQLTEWRAWRDAAWAKREALNRSPYNAARVAAASRARRKAKTRAQAKPRPPVAKPPTKKPPIKKPPTTRPPQGWASVADKKNAAVQAFRKRNPNVKILNVSTKGGIVVQTKHGPHLIPWSRLFDLL